VTLASHVVGASDRETEKSWERVWQDIDSKQNNVGARYRVNSDRPFGTARTHVPRS
jgi:hypothetical protein